MCKLWLAIWFGWRVGGGVMVSDKDVSGFSALARAIMENYTCLVCHAHYKKVDDAATCPKCGRTRKEQIELLVWL